MKPLLLATAAALVAAPTGGRAEAAPAAKAVDEIVVTATRSQRPLQDLPVSVSVVTGADIAETPGQSLDDILRRVPSVDLPLASSYQLHPTSLNVSMRGLAGIRALVLLDGVPLNDPFFGYVQWNRAPLETIDRVEIVRGGGATLWGNYAMGGVINVLTKTPDEDQLALQAGGGSYGTYRADAAGGLVVSQAVKLGFEAAASHTDGFITAPKDLAQPIDVPTAFTAYNAAFTGELKPTASLTGHFRIGYHENHQTLGTPLSINNQRTWTYSADATQDFGERGAVTLTSFHDDSRFGTDNTDTPAGAQAGTAEFVQNRHVTPVHDTGASLVWTKTLQAGWLRGLTAGVDYHGIEGTDVADIFVDTGAQIRTDIGGGKQRFLGGFGQVSLRPVAALEVLASLRYQSFDNYDAYDGAPGGLGHVPDKRTSSVDPRISARWAVTPVFGLRAAAYEAFRAPTLDNLYRAFSTPSGIFLGNPALVPETLRGGEAGFDVNRGGLRVQVTGYTNTIRNLITYAPLPQDELPPGFFYGTRNINAGRARSRGLEAEADWTIAMQWTGAFGYTFADSTIVESEFDPASVGKQQAGVPRQRIDASVTYTAAAGWRVTPQLRWVSESWGDNDETLPIPAHLVVDLALNYPVTHSLEAFVQIENLFDNRYIADNSGFELPRIGTPFSAFAGVRWVIGR
jgi:outer membrane receptor protein involved in Fe transport